MREVNATVVIHTPPERVIRAFWDHSMLSGWWGVEQAYTRPKAGAPYILTWQNTEQGFGYITSGVISAYDRESHLEIDRFMYLNPQREILGPMKLSVKAEEKDEASSLYLCQSGYQTGGDWDWYYEIVKDTWPRVLEELKVFLESGSG